jgi:hypothetical protein
MDVDERVASQVAHHRRAAVVVDVAHDQRALDALPAGSRRERRERTDALLILGHTSRQCKRAATPRRQVSQPRNGIHGDAAVPALGDSPAQTARSRLGACQN